MKNLLRWRTGLQIVLAGSLCGTMFQAGCLGALGRNFNPCGTILACDPAEFDLLTIDPLEPDYEFNPTCVLPGLFNCSTPISLLGGTGDNTGTGGTGLTGGGATTTTTTTNTTNRGTTTGRTGNTGNTGGFGTGGFGF